MSQEIELAVGRVYRAKKPANINGFVNDRSLLWIGIDTVQYDSPSIRMGGKYREVDKSQFIAWASDDVTQELPEGAWESWNNYTNNKSVPQLRSYRVTITLKFPSVTHSGCELRIDAKNKTEAISKARSEVRRECLYDRHDGPLTYCAELL
ncbi:hypothetical protein [Eoetvoesiella caeni]